MVGYPINKQLSDKRIKIGTECLLLARCGIVRDTFHDGRYWGAAEGHSLHSGRPGAPKPAESEFLFRCYPDPKLAQGDCMNL